MKKLAKQMSLMFAAGAVGALANSLVVWIFGAKGITTGFGVQIAPLLTAKFLYPRLVWGGLWGFLFLLPMLENRLFARGLVMSLGPSLVQLFIIFPKVAGKGFLGIELGALTPVFVLIFNAIWGLVTALWLKWTDK
ncbi:MAG: hypothetical protein H8D81_00405 [Deltaproteobacteria bacterium]|nr:hypothetical protein [Deltaproteobacteria bacterium]